MNAHRPLKSDTCRIIVQPGKVVRFYVNPEARDTSTPLESGPPITDGEIIASRASDNWIISETHGGLPIMKIPGLRSLEEAFGYYLVEIERQINGRFVAIEDLGEM